jgi:hypothetical protein
VTWSDMLRMGRGWLVSCAGRELTLRPLRGCEVSSVSGTGVLAKRSLSLVSVLELVTLIRPATVGKSRHHTRRAALSPRRLRLCFLPVTLA